MGCQEGLMPEEWLGLGLDRKQKVPWQGWGVRVGLRWGCGPKWARPGACG